jgi:type II secretory pathway pseudopilin PulG
MDVVLEVDGPGELFVLLLLVGIQLLLLYWTIRMAVRGAIADARKDLAGAVRDALAERATQRRRVPPAPAPAVTRRPVLPTAWPED